MKNVLTLIVAGTMLASGAFARDFGFEERFRAKVGRYTPAEEARRSSTTATANQDCTTPTMTCCHRTAHKQTTEAVNPWVAAKLGVTESSAPVMKCEHNRVAEALTASSSWQRAKLGTTPTATAEATPTCCD